MSAQVTVRTFIAVLSSKLTQHDKAMCARESKRGRPNFYRLGLLFEAVDKVEQACAASLDKCDPQALESLRGAMRSNFNVPFGPVTWTEKQIDNWLREGKLPRIV